MITKPITAFCSLNMGQSPDSKTYNTDGIGMPFYQGNADFGDLHPVTRIWCSQPVKKAKPGDILISVRAPIGAMNIATEACCIGRGLAALTPNADTRQKYLYYAIQSRVDSLIAQGTGSTFKAISKKILEETLIPDYRPSEQDEIVTKIGLIDSAIASRQEQLQLLDQLVKSRFIELFGGEKYAKKPIRELVDRKIASARKTYRSNETIHYIDISSIDNKANVVTGTTEYIMADAPSRAQQCIQYGDILISTVRPNLRNIARNAYNGDNYVASSGFCVLRAQNCDTRFLLCAVLADDFTNAMTEVTTGANYPAIKDSDVLEYRIPVPPIELQEQFAAFVEQVDKSKFYIEKFVLSAILISKNATKFYYHEVS